MSKTSKSFSSATGKRAALLINTGSPETTRPSDVASYLRQFLMDPRVVDIPFLLRFFLVYCIIAPFRSKKSASLYNSIWKKEGSPLLVETRKLAKLVEKEAKIKTEIAMRYKKPSIKSALENLYKEGIKNLYVIPMFPHYAMSTYESVVKEVEKEARKYSDLQIVFKKPYYNDKDFLNALSIVAKPYASKKYVLFSYHSIPNRHLIKTDPTKSHCLQVENCCSGVSEAMDFCYKAQTLKTTELLAKKLGLKKEEYSISYQSAMPSGEWIGPSTEDVLKALPLQGVSSIVVLAPGFVTDNLETLEELAIRGKEQFLSTGGKEYFFVPCLNSSPVWSAVLAKWIKEEIA